MKMLKAIRYFLKHRQSIKALVEREEYEAEERKRMESRHRLKLCYSHRQEQNKSHYASHNCDYCNAIKGKIREVDAIDKEDDR